MNHLITALSVFLICVSANGARLATGSFPWQTALKEAGIRKIYVCGDRNIQPTKKSIQRNFHVGPNKEGYLITGLFSIDQYFQILTDNNLEPAKEKLLTELSNVNIWRVEQSGKLHSLGRPSTVQLPFTATVKDCVAGARTTLGNDCSRTAAKYRESCCREKFIGPVLEWTMSDPKGVERAMKQTIKLHYSPDPSVGLQVPKESVRFCNVSTSIDI